MLQPEKVTTPDVSMPEHVFDSAAPFPSVAGVIITVMGDKSVVTTFPVWSTTSIWGWGENALFTVALEGDTEKMSWYAAVEFDV
jgi:hypothetical protein